MLVDGMTGRILEETRPVSYSGNPGLDIPERWWSEEASEIRRRRASKPAAPAPFWRETQEAVWRTAGGKEVRVAEAEDASLSGDGRWLAIFHSRWVEDGPPARIRFRIIDGSTGEERSLEIPLPAREGLVHHAAWERPRGNFPFIDERKGLAPIAVGHGIGDALETAFGLLGGEKWLAHRAREAILRHTEASGSDEELKAFHEKNKGRFRWNKDLKKFFVDR